MDILIIGASGMAGHLISYYFREKKYNVTTLAGHHALDQNTVLIDVTNVSFLRQYLSGRHFDVIINCCGMLIDASNANKSASILVNSYLPILLQELYSDTDTKIIHLSTDCVFSGDNGPYKENSIHDGLLFYDRTKSLGEIISPKDLTFRMSIIGPDINPDGIGLLNWFLKQKGTINGYSNVLWNGITTLELAKAIENAIHQNLCGLYHLTPKEYISKYQLLILFKSIFKKEDINIIPYNTIPKNKVLINTRTDFNYHLSSYEKMLLDIRSWIVSHYYIYPHYEKYVTK